MKKKSFVILVVLLSLCVSGQGFSMGTSPDKPDLLYCETVYPIILVPGVTGFDKLIGYVDYWYGIPAALEADGAVVFSAALTGWQSTEERGMQLLNFILDIQSEYPEYTKFNVIAHSHGATTSRFAMSIMPEAFASLTTIAGPHQGTPAADYMNEDLTDTLKPLVFGGIELFTGDLVALLSGHTEFVGTQDVAACVAHFTMDGIEAFNSRYPCAGVPGGSTRGLYGGDADTPQGALWGNGLGSVRNGSEDDAIRFYSWTGNVGKGDVTSPDLLDAVMVATNTMMRERDYQGSADGFIPVTSARFGEVLSDSYYWNHLDEINQTLGIRFPLSANPVSVFRQHANRLQNAGL